MQYALVAILTCFTLAAPTIARAQRGASPPFDGPRGALSFSLSDGEPVSFYLEVAREIELSDDQRSRLIEVRRKLRLTNAPFMRQLDSLRQSAGVDMTERGGLTRQDTEALKRFRQISAPVVDSIRVNNEGAKNDIRSILAERQMVKADSIAQSIRDSRGRRSGDRERRPGESRPTSSNEAERLRPGPRA